MKGQEDNIVMRNLRDHLVKEHIMRYIFASGHTENKVVLDIACGTGYGSNFLRKAGAREVFGVDISAETIGFASSYYKKDGGSFCIADATRVPFGNNTFDVVISFETIEHLRKYRDFLIEVKRVLKPEGRFILSTPNKRYGGHPVWHVKEFYPWEFFELLGENFRVLGKYAQYAGLGSRVRVWAVTKISLFLSSFHFGNKVRDFTRRYILRTHKCYAGAEPPKEITNEFLFSKHSVKPLTNYRLKIPRIIIAVCGNMK